MCKYVIYLIYWRSLLLRRVTAHTKLTIVQQYRDAISLIFSQLTFSYIYIQVNMYFCWAVRWWYYLPSKWMTPHYDILETERAYINTNHFLFTRVIQSTQWVSVISTITFKTRVTLPWFLLLLLLLFFWGRVTKCNHGNESTVLISDMKYTQNASKYKHALLLTQYITITYK